MTPVLYNSAIAHDARRLIFYPQKKKWAKKFKVLKGNLSLLPREYRPTIGDFFYQPFESGKIGLMKVLDFNIIRTDYYSYKLIFCGYIIDEKLIFFDGFIESYNNYLYWKSLWDGFKKDVWEILQWGGVVLFFLSPLICIMISSFISNK
jgi:hypothetical protein